MKQRSKLLGITLGDDILDLTSKAKAIKAKIRKWYYIKLKSFCMAMETVHKMKRLRTEWDKIFMSHICGNRFRYKNTKNSYNLMAKLQTI